MAEGIRRRLGRLCRRRGPPHPPVTSSYRPSLPSSTVNSRSQRREANPGAPLKGRGRSRKRDDHPWPLFDLNDLVEHWHSAHRSTCLHAGNGSSPVIWEGGVREDRVREAA
jgi:hypothetical protein